MHLQVCDMFNWLHIPLPKTSFFTKAYIILCCRRRWFASKMDSWLWSGSIFLWWGLGMLGSKKNLALVPWWELNDINLSLCNQRISWYDEPSWFPLMQNINYSPVIQHSMLINNKMICKVHFEYYHFINMEIQLRCSFYHGQCFCYI